MAVRKKLGERNVKLSVTIKPEQEKWIKKKLEENKYYNRSHVIQEAIRVLQSKDNGNE
jgi:Arc/MetJ-type ribon-helix-helix transcriptional regulator